MIRRASIAVLALAFGVPKAAHAEPMDPALARLVENPSCRDAVGRFVPPEPCRPDNAAFLRLVNQFGYAFAPTAMHSARTTGFGGMALTLEGAYTTISGDASYMRLGTRGASDPSSQEAPTSNPDPSSLLQLYSVKLRKGFGFGLELAGAFGFMPHTSLMSGGVDARISLLEGFRTGVLGIFPDVAVGGGVRTITGSAELQLTVASVDVQIGKPLPIAGTSVLTPWIGYQRLWMFGDSNNIDLTPATDAQDYCGYAGINTPGNPDPRKPTHDGQAVCTSPDPNAPLDFHNNVVFRRARLERNRLLVGFNYRYEIVTAGAQLITDLVSPESSQNNATDSEILEGEPRQWTFVLELGAHF